MVDADWPKVDVDALEQWTMTPLLNGVLADFAFDSQATTVRTTLPELLEIRAGLCPDFAHLALGRCAR